MVSKFFSDSWSAATTKISNGYQMATSGVSYAYSATTTTISEKASQVYEAAQTTISNNCRAAGLKVLDVCSHTTAAVTNASREAFQNYEMGSILASGLLAGLETWAIGSATPSFLVTATRYVVLTGAFSGIIALSYRLGENEGEAPRTYEDALVKARETLIVESLARGMQLCHFTITKSQAAQQWINQRQLDQEGQPSISIEKINSYKETANTAKLFAQKTLEISSQALQGSTRLFEPLGSNRTTVALGTAAGLATLVLSGTVYQLDPTSCALIAAISSPILKHQYEKWNGRLQVEGSRLFDQSQILAAPQEVREGNG